VPISQIKNREKEAQKNETIDCIQKYQVNQYGQRQERREVRVKE
jgi:hypothetical protein